MAVRLIVIGKTKERYFQQSEAEYLKRLQRYARLEYIVLPAAKHEKESEGYKRQEAAALLQRIRPQDFLILLDEGGETYTSIEFSKQLERWQHSGRTLTFVIGGAFGFNEDVHLRADAKLSLSKMTMPHHLVRTVFLEQLYRAHTLLKGGKYHNEG